MWSSSNVCASICQVQGLFRMEHGEVFHIKVPTSRERRNFFEDLILNQAVRGPVSRSKAGENQTILYVLGVDITFLSNPLSFCLVSVLRALEVLPLAPPPPPRQLTEEETQKLEEQEEDTLRELRLFLRDVTNRLSQDKRFKAFTKPVDLEEVVSLF